MTPLSACEKSVKKLLKALHHGEICNSHRFNLRSVNELTESAFFLAKLVPSEFRILSPRKVRYHTSARMISKHRKGLLSITSKIAADHDLFVAVVLQDIWSQVLGEKIPDLMAETLAFAMVWDSVVDARTREKFEQVWVSTRALQPKKGRSKPKLLYFLQHWGKYFFGKYRELQARYFLCRYNGEKDEKRIENQFYYSIPLDFSVLTPNDLKIWKGFVTGTFTTQSRIAEKVGMSTVTVSKSYGKLSSLMTLYRPVRISGQAVGLSSYFMICPPIKGDLEELKFPVVEERMRFSESGRVDLVHFYTSHNDASVEKWWREQKDKTKSNNFLLGREIERHRRNVMNPLLLEKIGKKQWAWKEGDRGDVEVPRVPAYQRLNALEKRVFLEMLKGFEGKNAISDRMSKDVNKVTSAVNMLLDKSIITWNYEMPFFSSLDRNLLIFDYSESNYEMFLEKIMSKIPYGKSTVVSNILSSKKYVIALIGLPPLVSRTPIRIFYNEFENPRVSRLISNATSSIKSNMQLKEDKWNPHPLPPLVFEEIRIGFD